MARIYTKTGDKGTTALYGGERVPKNHSRLEAYGTVDELNSHIGLANSFVEDKYLKEVLSQLQNDLFDLGGDLATRIGNKKLEIKRIDDSYITRLENIIDKIQAELPPLKVFILPGGLPEASHLQVARAVCRRAERNTITLSENEEINKKVIVYLNRLSDLLFVLARYANFKKGVREPFWEPQK